MRYEELTIEGRNAVLEAFRSGKTIDKLFVLDGCQDGPVRTILREAKKHDTIVQFVKKERLDQLSQTGHHQGVIASAAAYEYAEISDILQNAKDKGEAPFIIFLDNIEDPHNLGAIIRTANLAGAHGVVIPKRRAVGLTATVARVSAGAELHTGCKSNQHRQDDRRTEGGRYVVCLCRYGRRNDVQSQSERTNRSGDRQRRGRCQQAGKRKMRFCGFYSDERGYRFPECICGSRRPCI